MPFGGFDLGGILPTLERMLGASVNEAQLHQVRTNALCLQCDPCDLLQMSRQSPRGPHAEQISESTGAALDCLFQQSKIPGRDPRLSPGPRLVRQRGHPIPDPSTFPVRDYVNADAQGFGHVLSSLSFGEHQQPGGSGPDPAVLSRGPGLSEIPCLRSCDSNRYGCRHEELPPSSSPRGSLSSQWTA